MAKNVNIKINADSKNAERGINKATESLNKMTKKLNANPVNKFARSFTPLGRALGVATSAIKKTVQVITDLNEAYLKQAKAEKQLEVAAKNNPYLNKSSVNQLKEFASHLQSIGTVGDEELLPLMAQLASSGRDQAQIQKIMSTALDMSASGVMSLDSAVTALNNTYNGTSGQLKKYSTELGTLSKEQLKNGDAVDLLAKQYKGMAEEVGKTVGAGEKLKNAWGDLKENVGEGFNKAITPVQNFFAKLITGWNNSIAKAKEYKRINAEGIAAGNEIGKGNSTLENQNSQIAFFEQQIKTCEELNAQTVTNIQNRWGKSFEEIYERYKKGEKLVKNIHGYNVDETLVLEEYKQNLSKIKTFQDALNSARAERDKLQKEEEERIEKETQNNKIQTALKNYYEKIENAEKVLADKKKIYSMSEVEELTEKYQEMQGAAIACLTELDGLQSEESKKWLEQVQANITKGMQEIEKAKEKEAKAQKKGDKTDDKKNPLLEKYLPKPDEIEQTKQDLKALEKATEEFVRALPDDLDLVTSKQLEQFDQLKGAIKGAQDELDKLNFDKFMENTKLITDGIVSNLQSLADSVQKVGDIQSAENQKRTEKDLSLLEEQYEQGIIDYEEYNEKRNEIDKKAAQEEYEIKMKEWTVNMAVATAQVAQAVINALASGSPPVNILNATAAGLLGAAQLATIAGSKPVPPSFATGGFLTGNSYSGDKIPFMGNAGEAILNPAEQRNFMDMANGNFKGGVVVNMPIKIENHASKDVSVSAEQNSDNIRITVMKIVKSEMEKGNLNNSLNKADSLQGGTRIL